MSQFKTITDALAGVCGAGAFYTYTLPTSPNARPNPGLVGSGISAEQQAANGLLKQRLMDKRWIRHKDIPDYKWHQDGQGFWHLPYPENLKPALTGVAHP